MKPGYFIQLIMAVTLILLWSLPGMAGKSEKYGVYQYVIESADQTLEDISAALETAAVNDGWQLLGKTDSHMEEGCSYRARVIILFDAAYADQMMTGNRKTGPFGVADRIAIFEDENGTHVSIVNPHAMNRTILMDDEQFTAMSDGHREKLRTLITGAVSGPVSDREYGEFRKKGHIGKTMGVMAGGPFADKLEDELVVPGEDWEAVAARVREGLSKAGETWGCQLVYEIALPEYQTVVFGSNGLAMASKSYDIVQAGSDKSRKKLSCPGLAYAAAYPIEVVVAREDDGVKVRVVNTMYRMKMYFEDAGMWAFMKNMKMPGSIQEELRGQIQTALVTP